MGPEIRVIFEAGEQPECTALEDTVRIILDENAAGELSRGLVPKESVLEIPSLPGTLIRIVKTNIKDSDGNVVEVIG